MIGILVTTLFVGFMDLWTGYRLAFSAFYLIPVFLASYYVGILPGLFISILSASLWFLADSGARGGYINNIVPVWNTSIRLCVFLSLTFALHHIRLVQKKKNDLTNFIIHDLRTPLTIILEGLYLLNEGREEDRKMLTDLCLVSCNRMNTLVDSILDISKIESGKMRIDLSDVRVKGLVERALEGVSVWAQRNEIKIVSEYEDEQTEFKTDKDILYRVLINLLSNAIKWSSSGQSVSVRVSAPKDGKIRFSVRDKGIGIPGKMTKKVFGKFTQLGVEKETNIHGSGLGLNF
ncbi:MAG: HAMP domain-containing sensor histidine kinase, partial [Candidatus Omnitrophota bacterium]